MITQAELAKYVEDQLKIKKVEDKLKLEKAKLDDIEANIIQRLQQEEAVEKGKATARVKVSLGRASVKWKEVVEEIKGKLFVEKMLASAERPERKELEVIVE